MRVSVCVYRGEDWVVQGTESLHASARACVRVCSFGGGGDIAAGRLPVWFIFFSEGCPGQSCLKRAPWNLWNVKPDIVMLTTIELERCITRCVAPSSKEGWRRGVKHLSKQPMLWTNTIEDTPVYKKYTYDFRPLPYMPIWCRSSDFLLDLPKVTMLAVSPRSKNTTNIKH